MRILPSQIPKQVTKVVVITGEYTGGLPTVFVIATVQEFASVTLTVNAPQTFGKFATVLLPVLDKALEPVYEYVKFGRPPVKVTVALPLHEVLQVVEFVFCVNTIAAGAKTVTVCAGCKHELASLKFKV